MFGITGLTHLILALGITASKSLPQKGTPSQGCELKANTLIVEGSIKVSCAAECQKKCQKDDCCQFFTYNMARKSCGLRNFVPQARSFSLGNISGLKNESPFIWSKVSNSVYVAKSFKTKTAADCQTICLADNECKAMIFNKLLGQCSLNYGEGPYREIPLGNQSQFGISSCIKTAGSGTGEKRSNAILITGGFLDSRQDDYPDVAESENILANNCTIPNLPKPVSEHALVFASDAGGKKQILSCGGEQRVRNSTSGILGRIPTKDCYALRFGKSGNAEWTLYNSFTENLNYLGRSPLRTTAVFLPRYGTYIFGGFSSQFLLVGTSDWQKGPTAVEAGVPSFRGNCAVAINEEEFLIMGANFVDKRKNRVSKYNAKTGQWTRMPDLKIGRFNGHDCEFFKGSSRGDYVLVTGGYADKTTPPGMDFYSKTTEMYYIPSGESKIVGDLNKGRYELALVKVASPKETIYAVGGGRRGSDLSSVEEWDDINRAWKMTSIKLSKSKRLYAYLAVARDMICPK